MCGPVVHDGPFQGHVLHYDPPGLHRLLCLSIHLARVIGGLHRFHGWRRLHGGHRLHRRQRVFPHARQGTRLDVTLLDPPLNLFGPERGFVSPRLDLFSDFFIRPAHGLVHPALCFPRSPLLIAYAHTMPPFGFLSILARASVRSPEARVGTSTRVPEIRRSKLRPEAITEKWAMHPFGSRSTFCGTSWRV